MAIENKIPSIITYIDTLFFTAIERGASDIHLEPHRSGLHIRLRIDGVLEHYSALDPAIQLPVISRIKVLSELNIAEKRLPQDGKITITYNNRPIDLRVATFPTPFGEKLVIRILDRSHTTVSLSELGFQKEMLQKIVELIRTLSGFIIVTGPTGSGKTTTLYSLLTALQSQQKHIITLEDPIEYYLEGVTQGQINATIGFTFDKGIRSMMRQDPDILMIGEMRDRETAHAAVQAALTGHLVFSTLHTNDTISAFMRLHDMGIEPFLLNAAITAIIGQRLVRRICNSCKTAYTPTALDREFCLLHGINPNLLYHGTGCSQCFNTGYKGRIALFELMTVSEDLKSLIQKKSSYDELKKQALCDGLITYDADARQKIHKGLTSLTEFMTALS